MSEKPTPESFNKAYATLKKNAELLQSQAEPDIDRLVPIVEESMAAYKTCQDRIAAVKQALAKQIGNDDTPTNADAA